MKTAFIAFGILIGTRSFAQKSAVLDAFAKYGINTGSVLNPDIVDIPDNLAYDYKYTMVNDDKDKVFIARYDPSETQDNGWSLISVNGKSPTSSNIRNFKRNHPKPEKAARKIDETSMKVEKETTDKSVISYRLVANSLPPSASFMKDCRNYLTINLQSKRLEKLQCLNEKTVKVRMVNAVKLDITVDYSYNEEQRRYLPWREDQVVIFQLLGQQSPTETISEYSNYKAIR